MDDYDYCENEPYEMQDAEKAMALLTTLRHKYNLPDPPCCDSHDVTLVHWHMDAENKRLQEALTKIADLRTRAIGWEYAADIADEALSKEVGDE